MIEISYSFRFFDGYGKIRDIAIKFGFAFIDFEDERDAEDACHDLNGKTMAGDRLVLLFCIIFDLLILSDLWNGWLFLVINFFWFFLGDCL